MKIDPSAHRTSFISATGVSAKATFLSALPLVLRGNVIVFSERVKHFNLERSCIFHGGIRMMVHVPHMLIVYIAGIFYPCIL